ncbi:MAG TPA: hypothetical protein VFF30_14575 [Nitrososphaerales archaeon]|nr:hypothetical protein [Nitrososphaerales archaeon]
MSGILSKFKEELRIRLLVTITLALSSTWLLVHALVDAFGNQPATSFFYNPAAEVVRILLGIAGIVATALQAYYWKRSIVDKTDLKIAINHYVKNRMQFLLLTIELYNMDSSQENLAMLFKAREECQELVKEVDLIVREKRRAPMVNSMANAIESSASN